ncbi:hypothetical protein COCON_G00221560 [Conger conger]|uniref:Fibronectin type-III domain-containing protein n=1 Tax=Conger conger TaxID=82655 RepID=A0A9Q1HND0_CONCO|nr:hypothetical protein COCON_G00221560 [Conger conger]
MNCVAPTMFVVLLFLEKSFSVEVPPPVNLTIECHNFITVAHWNYSQPSLHPHFLVKLLPYGGDPVHQSCVNTTHHHCDVSNLVHVTESYFLSVKAEVGSGQSVVVQSDFTYNRNLVESKHCSVEFPPVTLSVDARKMLKFQFRHPLDFYKRELWQVLKEPKTKRTHYEEFTYNVLYGEDFSKMPFECHYAKGLCEGYVPISEGQERLCIQLLDGELCDLVIAVSEKTCLDLQNTTTEPVTSPEGYYSVVFWPVVAVVALVVFTMVVFLLIRRKTNGTSAIHKIMTSVLAIPSSAGKLLQPESEVTSPVLSLDPQEDPVLDLPPDHLIAVTLDPQDRSRFPLGVEPGQDQGQTCDRPEPRSVEEVESSGYDRPHVVLSVEMNPGDRVQGYKPTQA